MNFVLFILMLNAGAARAMFLPGLYAELSPPGDEDGYFVSPNELTPADAKPILRRAPAGGLYLAVGTERGFIGFAQSAADKLLLFDRDPLVVQFNRVNVALLARIHGRADYLNLRRATQTADLRARLGSEFSEPTLAWFVGEHQKSQPLEGLRRLLDNDSADGSFADANYLHDDVLFERVQLAAQRGWIQSVQIDVTARAAFRRMAAQIQKAESFIAVVDFSNMGLKASVGSLVIMQALRDLQNVVRPQSLLLITGSRRKGKWGYFGATFEHLLNPDNLRSFKNVHRLLEDSDSGRGAGKTRVSCGRWL